MFHIHRTALSGYNELAAQLNINPDSMLIKAGLRKLQLQEADTHLPFRAVANLLELTASHGNEPLLGTRLASLQGVQIQGDLGISASQQPTVLAALHHMREHGNLIAAGMKMIVKPMGETTELQVVFNFDTHHGMQQITQLVVGKLYELIKYLSCAHNYQPSIYLQQARPPGTLWQWQQLKNYMTFNNTFDGIRFPTSWLSLPPKIDPQTLQTLMASRLHALQSNYSNTLESKAVQVITRLLPNGECSIAQVAKMLGLHPRTLQKRLKTEGLSFGQLLQNTRLQIAKHALRQPDNSITDIALKVGYAEIAVFSRHFKKWTGLTPSQFKAKAR